MKALVVDDHVLIRDALRGVLASVVEAVTVLEAGTAFDALGLLEANPDLELVLLDVNLPDRNGLDLLDEVRAKYPGLCTVMLSGSTERDYVMRALDRGAQGFIPKTDPRPVLVSALRLILAGGLYIPPEILGRSPSAAPTSPPAAGPTNDVAMPTPAELGLTERQLEVLALMMEGKSNKLICRALHLAEPTVKNHVSAILKALDVASRAEAIVAVTARGWVLPRPPSRGG